MRRDSLRLYAVTDRTWLNGKTLAELVEQAILGGATLVQIREKEMPYARFLDEAKALKAVTDRYGVPLIVNDNVDIALESGAAGVHVGQSDASAGTVRAALGPGRLLGVSVQTAAQAVEAEQCGADYLGVGAVFPTSTKADADTVTPATLRQICQSVTIPVVAIGGIGPHNIGHLRGCGLAGVAVVSALFAAPDVRRAAESLYELALKMVEA